MSNYRPVDKREGVKIFTPHSLPALPYKKDLYFILVEQNTTTNYTHKFTIYMQLKTDELVAISRFMLHSSLENGIDIIHGIIHELTNARINNNTLVSNKHKIFYIDRGLFNENR